VIGEADDRPLLDRAAHGIAGRVAGALVDDAEDLVERAPRRFGARPSREVSRRRD
jgi:hypothetical protein